MVRQMGKGSILVAVLEASFDDKVLGRFQSVLRGLSGEGRGHCGLDASLLDNGDKRAKAPASCGNGVDQDGKR